MSAVYGALSIVLVVAVVAVAYGTQAPQLAVAEFAPAARQSVQPPPTTADSAGAAAERDGRSPRATATTTSTAPPTGDPGAPSASVPTTRSSRTRACVGNPPRQIEDPHAPPCVATIFDGENGGSTSTGVTGTEIKVAVPMASDDADMKAMVAAYFEFFNLRYEFYGRRLVPDFVLGATGDAVQSRKLAVDVAARQVFASLSFRVNFASPPPAYLSEIARQRVVTVALEQLSMLSDATVFDALHPYVWSVFPSLEQRYRAVTDLVCRSLASKPASHAGPGVPRSGKRRFAVIAMADRVVPSTNALEEGLAGCADVATTVKLAASGLPAGSVRTAMEKLKVDGVTTIVCVCGDSSFPSSFMGEAQAASYFPEWLPLYSFPVEEFYGNFVAPGAGFDQLTNIIMMSPNHKATPLQVRPSFNAMLAMRPDLAERLGLTLTFYGDLLYKELTVLAAGIQGAGPALTADAFAQALMAMDFPNPGAGQAPYWQQGIGFGPGDHSLYDDFALAWWSRKADVVDPKAPVGKGSWCYVNQGNRYQAGSFPADADELLFDSSKPCR